MAQITLSAPVRFPGSRPLNPRRGLRAATGGRTPGSPISAARPSIGPAAAARPSIRPAAPRAAAPRAATGVPRQSSAPAPRLGLTRRGRFLLIGMPVMFAAAALLVLAGIFTAPVMAAGADGTAPVQGTAVTVVDGETLWGLAGEFAPARDRMDVIAEIAELNNLNGSMLVPGQEIFIPVQP